MKLYLKGWKHKDDKNYYKASNVNFGHIFRREKLEYLVSTGQFEGKNPHGMQRQGYDASMKRRMGQS